MAETTTSKHSMLSRRSFIAGAFAVLSSLALDGCQSNSVDGGASTTITVTDSVGRSVEVPRDPDRIAGLDSFTGELMVMCGAGPKLVATPGGVVSDLLLREIYPDLVDVPAPMANSAINMETLLETNPQVIIIKEDVYSVKGQRALLDKANLPYVVVGYTTMDEQIFAMELVGQVCGGEAETRANALADYYRECIDECSRRAADISDDERIRVYHSINALVTTDGADSLGRDWIESVGAIDVSAEDPDAFSATDYMSSLEQIYAWDPDVFVCNSADTTEYLLAKDNCAGLTAVKNKRCHTIPVGATRWGQRGSVETYLAMLWLGVTVYPDHYAGIDLQERVTSYYHDYLGVEVDDELYAQMLSGVGLRKQSGKAGS